MRIYRIGYFCVDSDSSEQQVVFNRTVTLKDSWAKIAAKEANHIKEKADRYDSPFLFLAGGGLPHNLYQASIFLSQLLLALHGGYQHIVPLECGVYRVGCNTFVHRAILLTQLNFALIGYAKD